MIQVTGGRDALRAPRTEEGLDRIRVATFFGVLGVVALCFTVAYAARGTGSVGAAVLWSLALWISGAFTGFLFGIPKVLQGTTVGEGTGQAPPAGQGSAEPEGGDAARRDYRQRINTNLEEISDWITKIIVGLGLVNLKSIPRHVTALALAIAPTMGAGAEHASVATAMAIFYPLGGFLFGYLLTRLFLQAALARADVRAQDAASADAVKIASIEERQHTLRRMAETARPGTADAKAVDVNAARAAIERLAREYMTIDDPDWATRTRRKNDVVNQIAELALGSGISKEELARMGNEPVIAAVATCINANPEPGDASLLLRVGRGVSRLHVKYKVVVAFAALVTGGWVDASQRKDVLDLVESYRQGADPSLLRNLDSLAALVGSRARSGVPGSR